MILQLQMLETCIVKQYYNALKAVPLVLFQQSCLRYITRYKIHASENTSNAAV